MSKDKNRAERRRLRLLRNAKACKEFGSPGIMLNHEGGFPADNRDLKEAVKRGLLRIWRGFYYGGTTYGKGGEIRHGNTPRTWAVITDAGLRAIETLGRKR